MFHVGGGAECSATLQRYTIRGDLTSLRYVISIEGIRTFGYIIVAICNCSSFDDDFIGIIRHVFAETVTDAELGLPATRLSRVICQDR